MPTKTRIEKVRSLLAEIFKLYDLKSDSDTEYFADCFDNASFTTTTYAKEFRQQEGSFADCLTLLAKNLEEELSQAVKT